MAELEQNAQSASREPKPHATLLRLGLTSLNVHFRRHGFISTSLLETCDVKVLKKMLVATFKEEAIRQELGNDISVWKDLTEVFETAALSLADRCYADQSPESPDYDTASSIRIVSHYQSLVKDIARLKDLTAIARNILCIGDTAQNLAAKASFDHAIFNIITLCIKVTARGFHQSGSSQDEEKWQLVINDYKQMLIKCLEFLNNLVAQNERRKLMLWVELFDSSTDPVLTQYSDDITGRPPEKSSLSNSATSEAVIALPTFSNSEEVDQLPPIFHELPAAPEQVAKLPAVQPPTVTSSPYLLFVGKVGSDIRRELLQNGKPADPAEIAKESQRRWENLSDDDKESWRNMYESLIGNPPGVECGFFGEALQALAHSHFQESPPKPKALKQRRASKVLPPFSLPPTVEVQADIKAYISVSGDQDYFNSELPGPVPATDSDYRMEHDAQRGLDILDLGKSDLLKRLEPDSEHQPRVRASRLASSSSSAPASAADHNAPSSNPDASDTIDLVSEDEESDEDDYPVPGDDGRGLLTDVPLILGPGEIEVLPMIIQSGIVPPLKGSAGYGKNEHEATAIKNMHAVRCHLLLAQNNGQNLLRELLIFVAAWDLREDDLYLQVMVKIMDAILMNGLMPFAYHAFREAKDIISPAQAVIMKLLTNIFRARQASKLRAMLKPATDESEPLEYPTSYEARMVKFLFSEFRNHIIPQTCALIFLQGKIRDGTASPEDFPLNLWDMERMYEGIYQYLEFFAILTEHDKWKWMMAEWELTSELVTLLEELDTAIPRSTLRDKNMHPPRVPSPEPPTNTGHPAPTPQPIAVERPYDVGIHELGYSARPPTPSAPQESEYVPPPADDEPSDFEWRNLKKLAVLVLSSLVWKSPEVQAQLGKPDKNGIPGRGVRALLKCCQIDDYNPYIKEHAIMALRFALENCEENQNIVRNLTRLPNSKSEASKTSTDAVGTGQPAGKEPSHKVDVPKEVLDLQGFETFVDPKGQVRLRRKKEGRGHGVWQLPKMTVAGPTK